MGTFNCCRTIVPNMIKNDYGRIVNVASVAGKDGNANASAYSVGKAGAIGLTKSLGKELAEKTITSAYTRGETLVTDRISATRVYDHNKEVVTEDLVPGLTCTALIEFSGLWFAKKAFGPSWNLVQMKIHEEKTPEPEFEEGETYPDQYIIEDTE